MYQILIRMITQTCHQILIRMITHESINIIGDENNLETLIKKANELLFSLLPIEQISFHIHNILNLIPNLEKEDVSDILEPLKIHLDFDKPRVYNMIGCRMYQWQQATKKVNCEIARLHKKIHNLESKVCSFYHESQINSYMQMINPTYNICLAYSV